MCGGGGGGNATLGDDIQQQQITQQAQISAAQLAEQQREFDVQQQQASASVANTQALQAQQQAATDQQAALTNQWETGRAAEQATATGDVNSAFAAFTPDYYKQYTQDYINHYTPQVQDQFDTAQNNTTYGLARTGNLQSQTGAYQDAQLQKQLGTALDDVSNQATGATTALQTNVQNAKASLLSQATSDATLGSPVTPGSSDAITANFNNTGNAISSLASTAGDTISALQATPTYSSLGSLFGSAATTAASAVAGNNAYNATQAANKGATDPTGAGSAKVSP